MTVGMKDPEAVTLRSHLETLAWAEKGQVEGPLPLSCSRRGVGLEVRQVLSTEVAPSGEVLDVAFVVSLSAAEGASHNSPSRGHCHRDPEDKHWQSCGAERNLCK